MFSNQAILNVLLLVPVFLFSLCVHEFAHAWVATRRGDPTAAQMGRLTLHPLAHADMLGTLILPVLCVYYGMPFFAWAKPVPVDIRNLPNGRRDMALVAAAGPLSNILLAVVATGALATLVRLPSTIPLLDTFQIFAAISIQVNLMLAFFNLIPLPPLDGFQVLSGFLPRRRADQLERLTPYAGFALLVLLVTGGLHLLSFPARLGFRWLVGLAGA